jgi:DNA-directed RNA polymerase subunit F
MTYTHTSSPYPSDADIVCATCGAEHSQGALVRRRVTNTDGPVFEVAHICPQDCEAPLLVVPAAEIEIERLNAEIRRLNETIDKEVNLRSWHHHQDVVREAKDRYDQLHKDYVEAANARDRLQGEVRRRDDALMQRSFENARLEKLLEANDRDHLATLLDEAQDELIRARREYDEDIERLEAQNDSLRADLLKNAEETLARQESFNRSNDAIAIETLKRELAAANADIVALNAELASRMPLAPGGVRVVLNFDGAALKGDEEVLERIANALDMSKHGRPL